MKRKYEIVYIFDSALEEPEIEEHLTRFHELLKSPDQPEPITGIAHWGKRTLAYPIKNKEIGYYVVAQFEAETQLLQEFERVIKLSEAVLRYLVVINEGLSVARPDHMDSDDTLADDDDDEDDDEVLDEGNEPEESAKESSSESDASAASDDAEDAEDAAEREGE